MKAAICYEFGKPLKIEDINLVSPVFNEVRIKISACAICKSDVSYIKGLWGGRLPMIVGHEASGTIVEVGSNVQSLHIGDRVVISLIRYCGNCFFCLKGEMPLCEASFNFFDKSPIKSKEGRRIYQGLKTAAFAEEVIVDKSQVVKIPADLPFVQASLLGCGIMTGVGSVLNVADVSKDSNVVLVGCGGVGINCLQGCLINGVKKIIVVDPIEKKLNLALKFGATHAFSPYETDLKYKIKKLTNGRGADTVFINVGNVNAINEGINFLRKAGSLIVLGMTGLGEKISVEALDIGDKAIKIIGSKMGSSIPRRDIPFLINHIKKGNLKLKELVSNLFPLDKINDAVKLVEEGEDMRNIIYFD